MGEGIWVFDGRLCQSGYYLKNWLVRYCIKVWQTAGFISIALTTGVLSVLVDQNQKCFISPTAGTFPGLQQKWHSRKLASNHLKRKDSTH